MKKITKLLSGLLCLSLIMTGCSNDKNKEDDTKVGLETYIQSAENTKYEYDGEGSEYSSFESWVDYKKDGKVQLRTNNSGIEMVQVYKVEDGKLIVSFSQGETYHRENFLDRESNSNEVILMEPIQKGTTWKLESGEERTITDTEFEIETPSGKYKAVEVTTVYLDSTTKDYYVSGIGLVKSEFVGTDEFKVNSTLSEIKNDEKLEKEVLMYYPNVDEEKYYYKEVKMSFSTNDEPEAILADAYKSNKPQNAENVLSESASINKFSFEPENGIVKLDMNEAFLQDMNAGSSYESMILQCLATTFGSYCYGENLSITIDGKPYESGHIVLDEGDYIQAEIQQEVLEAE